MSSLRSVEEADSAWRLGEQAELRSRVAEIVRGAYNSWMQEKLSVLHMEHLVTDAVCLFDRMWGLTARLDDFERRLSALEGRSNDAKQP